MNMKKGFTLIELLVVIAIIGILATLVIVQLGGARGKARNGQAKSDAVEAGKAVEAFKNDDAAGDKVITSGTTAVTPGTVDTLNVVTGANFLAVFTGTQSVTGLTYAVKIAKTPAAAYTYSYQAGTGTVARRVGATNYVVGTTGLNTGDPSVGAAADAYYVVNGSATSGASVPASATH